MNRTQLIRLSAAAVLGALVAGVSLAAVSSVSGGELFARCTVGSSYGWLVLLVATGAIGAAGWALLATGARKRPDESVLSSATCPECGGPVIDGWRLCPHCGAALGDSRKQPDA